LPSSQIVQEPKASGATKRHQRRGLVAAKLCHDYGYPYSARRQVQKSGPGTAANGSAGVSSAPSVDAAGGSSAPPTWADCGVTLKSRMSDTKSAVSKPIQQVRPNTIQSVASLSFSNDFEIGSRKLSAPMRARIAGAASLKPCQVCP